MNGDRLYEGIIILIIGMAIVVGILIFVVYILYTHKRWAENRDKHYTDKYNKLEEKFENSSQSTRQVIEDAAEVVSAAKEVIKKTKL